ncbi:MAG TPA: Ig-like domain repeat protein [Verrucomicrobiae bacterium]|nr:Ig-like domain repeat protein [Verrucomicrobiae bacterium]
MRNLSLPRLALLHFCLFLIPFVAWAQTPPPQSRIVERVNESALVTLRGNTHPLAQPQFDQGAAPPDLPMARMLLVLKRSDAQESALQNLLDGQQDRNSPSYHQWLTPDEFGQQFGPSDQDVQTVAAWLRSHGFQIGAIGRGRTLIEFSGTAAQVQQAFHTEIHKYTVNGEEHWANASDPQIPVALAPVVAGVNSLHNFPKKPMYRLAGVSLRSGVMAYGPDFTTNLPMCGGADNCYFVGPYDFAAIYNVLPLWNATAPIDGTGQAIAILNESNINIQDVRDFRSMFGLPANDPQVILNGPDPGLVQGVESEADLDVEWSGAVAKGATIKLIVTAPTNSTSGVDLSAVYAVENNVAPVISESFGECELFLGNAGNIFQSSIRQQAAAQGITYINSGGDEGSARCDPSNGNPPDPATHGLAISGLASSPYGVAVGGTDFLNFGSNYNLNSASPYWNSTNDPQHQASALGYVPETTWNDTCTNNVFVFLKAGANPEASCNNSQLANTVDTIAGGGGKSSCTTSDGTNPSSCSGGYLKPAWQVAPGVPQDGARDIPDVSLFAGNGFMDSAYIVCEADGLPFPQTCSLNSAFNTFLGIGGTSASAPSFAGIMALVNQFTNSSGQGNANYVMYKMAASSAQTSHACGATANPSPVCIFYDVISGTNAVPCTKGSPNCSVSNQLDLYGVLSGYNTATGYDLTTGLGSVNAANLVHNWIQPTNSSSTTLSLNSGNPVSITHGQSVSFDISVSPSAATGLVSLEGTPTGGGSISMASFPLQNGSASGSTASLAGGNSYSLKAHYSGNGTYAPSDSSLVTVTVVPEPSKTLITVPVFDPNTGKETGNTPTSVAYGTPLGVRVDVGNANASISFPSQQVCAQLTCPTGNVTITDSLNAGAAITIGATALFALNSGGNVEKDGVPLLGGSHQLASSYAGDNSYGPSSGTFSLTVTPASTQLAALSLSNVYIAGTQVNIFTDVVTGLFSGVAPTGTITFNDGNIPLSGTLTLQGMPGIFGAGASLQASFVTTLATSGPHQIMATYSGDANYAGSTSSASTTVFYPTTTAVTANSTNINLGQSVTITATTTAVNKSPQITGHFQFTGDPALPGTVTPTLTTDNSGNQVLTASVTITPQSSDFVQVSYSGDMNFEATSSNVFVNVIIPDFNLAANSPNLTITAGQTGTSMLTVTPLSNMSSTVALSCNLMDIVGASCSFNPATPLDLQNSAAASATLSIATLPPSSSQMTQFVANRGVDKKQIAPGSWWLGTLMVGLAILVLSVSPNQKARHLAANLSMICLLCVVLGCGAGNSGAGGGGGGGGGVGLSPTSVTLSTSSVKAPNGTDVVFTVTVNSSKALSGTIDLWDTSVSTGAGLASAFVVNGSATIHINYLQVGTHVISADYSGDANNQPSKTSGSINVAITGLTVVFVQGATNSLTHSMPINVTLE